MKRIATLFGRGLLLLTLSLTSPILSAQPMPGYDATKGDGVPAPQRVPTGFFESLPSLLSNVEFHATNYGIVGLDVITGDAGLTWPRGSGRTYLFGGGLWFGAEKYVIDDPDDPGSGTVLKKLSVIGYEPNTGKSWMVPGRVRPPYESSGLDQTEGGMNNYRLYRSPEYDPATGEPLDPADRANDGARWPLWMTTPGVPESERYVADMEERNRTRHPGGPAFDADEVVVATYKDTDLRWYEDGEDVARREGYPLGLQVEQTIYGWSAGPMSDAMVIRYRLINASNDTLMNCYAGLMLDPDLGRIDNDRATTLIQDLNEDSLDLALHWSGPESVPGYGLLGLDLLEGPVVDEEDFLFKRGESTGEIDRRRIRAFRLWGLESDPKTPEARYEFLSLQARDADNGERDIRTLMSTGPFNMRPGDTAQVAYALLFALPLVPNRELQWEDLDVLITLDRTVQQWWDGRLLVSGVGPDAPIDASAPRAIGIYPNPVGPTSSATILYDLPVAARAELRLYDPIGRLVERRDLGYGQGAGRSLRLDCAGLSAGAYTYEIRTEQGTARGSMMVLR